MYLNNNLNDLSNLENTKDIKKDIVGKLLFYWVSSHFNFDHFASFLWVQIDCELINDFF